jgi:hypothetical protein
MAKSEARDPASLLCEGCGYVIEGLPEGGRCPECGRAVRDSVPERRTGSPWQLAPGVHGWVHTAAILGRAPGTFFDRVSVESERSGALLSVNCALATVALLPVAVTRVVGSWPTREPIRDMLSTVRPSSPGAVVFAGVTWFVVAAALAWCGLRFLSWIEKRGLLMFSKRRGWRTTPSVAAAVCGHASYGWLAAAILALGGWVFARTSAWVWIVQRPWMQGTPGEIAWAPVIAGFFVGMLVFETLVYVGFRRMRFANQPRRAAIEPV